jgi:membrane-associated phospholipid phosphatase
MTVDQHELYVAHRGGVAAPASALRQFWLELGPQDLVVFFYLLGLNIAVLNAAPSAARTYQLTNVFSLSVLHLATLTAIRTGWLTHKYIAPLLYRVVSYGCVQITYFMFAGLLPLVNTRALDGQLYHLDLTIFGVEPAVYFDRFVNSFTTEWFAFFYFSYFFVLAMHVLPILFASKSRRLMAEFTLGMIVLFCVGHTMYMLVPGYGPYKAMPEVFAHELTPGFWWNTTKALVAESGAQKDIFPSLHTAAPTFILLFQFHRRAEMPFRYTWPLVGFFAANIIIATMFLRWHYVIDVVFGLCLAVTAHVVSVKFSERDVNRREALGLSPSWPEWT